MEQPIIEFHNASLEIPGTKFDDVYELNLTINRGEFFGLCGTRASGAQTFCLMINGLAPHATAGRLRGSVMVKGMDTREFPPKKLALHVGIVFDDPEGQFLGMTVQDHVSFAPENLNLPIPEIKERVEWALKAVGMWEMRARMLTDLSGGQKQRVAIAAALAMRTDVLVLSDITFALDPVGANEVYITARRLNQEFGITVIILDQDTEKLCEYCDRVAVMDKGRVICLDKPENVFPNLPENIRSAIRIPQITEFFETIAQQTPKIQSIPVTLEQGIKLLKASGVDLQVIPQQYSDNHKVTDPPYVEIKDLSFSYDGHTKALDGINVQINRGEFVALIGQNGSGKTTLVKHLIGLLSPTSGTVRVGGTNVFQESIGLLSRKVGFIFQNPDHQLFTSSVRKELSYGPKNLGMPPEEIETRITQVAQALGLSEHMELDPYQLSRGERQRVAIGSILAMGPELLILDEPTTGLYTEEARETLDYILRLNQEQKLAVIMISHDMRLISEYCSRAIVLTDGEVIADDTLREVFNDRNTLERSSLFPPQITLFAMNTIPNLDYAVLKPKELKLNS